MPCRFLAAFFLCVAALFAASFRLYLTDGTYQLVREYEVSGNRVRFYSIERSEWEEIPASLADLKRTVEEQAAREESARKDAEEAAAAERLEREQRAEREKVPADPGVYLVMGGDLKPIQQAESKVSNSKGRWVLKSLAPLPIVSGKASVELDGEHSANAIGSAEPEFYIRLASDERFGILRLWPKWGARVVQKWSIAPVTHEVAEAQQEIECFRQQADEGVYKLWPAKSLDPGEYAVVEWTQGKRNIQIWDFSTRMGRSK
jgi:hypothetical protein